VSGFNSHVCNHPGQLSLAILSWVGAIEYQPKGGDWRVFGDACGWGVKAGMVRV